MRYNLLYFGLLVAIASILYAYRGTACNPIREGFRSIPPIAWLTANATSLGVFTFTGESCSGNASLCGKSWGDIEFSKRDANWKEIDMNFFDTARNRSEVTFFFVTPSQSVDYMFTYNGYSFGPSANSFRANQLNPVQKNPLGGYLASYTVYYFVEPLPSPSPSPSSRSSSSSSSPSSSGSPSSSSSPSSSRSPSSSSSSSSSSSPSSKTNYLFTLPARTY